MRQIKCYGCKESFLKDEVIAFYSNTGKTFHYYCKKCYEERAARNKFADEVCHIFGLRSPGARIWKERQQIQAQYGFTDDTIVDCLEYLYKIEKKRKYAETIRLVTPGAVERMLRYKNSRQVLENDIQAQVATNVTETTVKIKENTTPNKKKFNLDDFE